MLSYAFGSIATNWKDKRRAAEKEDRTFELRSPLCAPGAKKGVELCNVNPYWAVLRAVGPQAAHNMEFAESSSFFPWLDFHKMPKTGLESVVCLPVLRNVIPIEKGQVLILKWYWEEDDEQ